MADELFYSEIIIFSLFWVFLVSLWVRYNYKEFKKKEAMYKGEKDV